MFFSKYRSHKTEFAVCVNSVNSVSFVKILLNAIQQKKHLGRSVSFIYFQLVKRSIDFDHFLWIDTSHGRPVSKVYLVFRLLVQTPALLTW